MNAPKLGVQCVNPSLVCDAGKPVFSIAPSSALAVPQYGFAGAARLVPSAVLRSKLALPYLVTRGGFVPPIVGGSHLQYTIVGGPVHCNEGCLAVVGPERCWTLA